MNHRLIALLCVGAVACTQAEPRRDVPEDRTPPIAPAPPSVTPGPRVVFLGTSLTAGLGLLRADDTYVSRLAELADSAGLPVDVVNAGVSGDTSAGGLRRLEWILRDAVDVLVVELGANDGLRGQDPEATKRNLVAIGAETRARYPEVRLVIVGMEAPTNLGEAYTRQFHDVFPAVASDLGAALVPFILDGIAGIPEVNQNDGIHPTPEGHLMMARNVWPVLEPLVREWWARHPDAPRGQ